MREANSELPATMNLPSTQDFSVYQFALNQVESSQSFKVSLDTLELLVGALIDVLIEKNISATLWAKVPPTGKWLRQLKRYHSSVGVSPKIYLCSSFREELGESNQKVSQVANQEGQFHAVQLADGKRLERECFLLILSEQLTSLIVVFQPAPSAAKPQHQPRSLRAIYTVEQQVIQQVFEEIKDAIAVDDSVSQEVLQVLETQIPQCAALDDARLLSQLLVKQLQRTEKILHPPVASNSKPHDNVAPLTPTELTHASDSTISVPLKVDDYLHDKDELIRRVAQELRTPLASMKTALKLLDSPQLKPPQRQRYMQLLNTECDRQNSLIAGLLDLVQLDSEPQPVVMPSVQLSDIVPGVVSTYQPLAQEKGIQIGYTIPISIPPVSCLEMWLKQIVINLLHNSLKFTPAGGQVKVKATLQGDYVQLGFEDSGIGIAASEIPRIFDSFYRGRSTLGENTGAGLGLTIVQQLLRRCGGAISVTSKLGEGCYFKVLLPVASQKNSEP